MTTEGDSVSVSILRILMLWFAGPPPLRFGRVNVLIQRVFNPGSELTGGSTFGFLF